MAVENTPPDAALSTASSSAEDGSGLVGRPLVWGVLLCGLLLAVAPIHGSGTDENMWSYIGWLWAKCGQPPYLAAFENKAPGVFLLHALFQAVLGTSIWPVRLLGIAATMGAAALAYSLGRRIGGHRAGLFSMVFLAIASSWKTFDGAYPGTTETFMVFFAILSMFLIVRGTEATTGKAALLLLGAGASASAAIQFKQIALADAVALAVSLVLLARRHRRGYAFVAWGFGLLLISGAAVAVLFALPVLSAGVPLQDYWYCAWVFLRTQGGDRNLFQTASQVLNIWAESRAVLLAIPLLFFLLLRRQFPPRLPVLGIAVWFVLDLLAASASNIVYGHQARQALPALAILCGLGMSASLEALVRKGFDLRRALRGALVLILVVGMPYDSLLWSARGALRRPPPDSGSIWLARQTAPDEPVYVWSRDSGWVLLQSQRRTASKYFNTIFAAFPSCDEGLRQDFEKAPPRVILVCQKDLDLMPAWFREKLTEKYAQAATPPGYAAYIRNNAAWKDANAP